MKTICMKTNEEITSYEPENFEENYKAYLVDLLSTNYKTYPNKEDAEKERKRIWEQLGGSEIAYSDIYILTLTIRKMKNFIENYQIFLMYQE